MTRLLYSGTFLVALGASVAALRGADTPPPPTLPDFAPPADAASARPPERVIKVEVGFEPWPLEEQGVTPAGAQDAPQSAPSPVPGLMPPVTPSAMPVPTRTAPPAAPQDAPKGPTLTLAALERMALDRAGVKGRSTPRAGGPITPACACQAAADSGASTIMQSGFVDLVVPASATMAQPGAKAALTPAQAQALAEQYRLLNGVRLRYYHLLALQRLIAVREELASVTRDAVMAIDGMTAGGQATKAELLQAKVEAREQMAALQNARAVHAAVWQRLAAMVGRPDLPLGTVAGDLEQCPPMPGFDAAWAHVVEASPDLHLVRAEVARWQSALHDTLGGSAGKPCGCDKNSSDGPIAQAFARITEPFTGVDPQVKQAAWAELSRCEAEVGRVEQSLRQRLADAYARYDRAKEVTDLYRTQNLPDAKEAYELSVLAYRQGRGSWPQVQIAQRNYFRMSTEYVESLAEVRRAELVILGLMLDGPDENPQQPAVRQAGYRQ